MTDQRRTLFPSALSVSGRAIALSVTRNRRARRMTLRYDGPDDTIRLVLPVRCSQREAMAFVESHTGWLAQSVARHPSRIAIDTGSVLPLFGRNITILATGEARGLCELTDAGELRVPGDVTHLKRRVLDFIKKQMHDYVQEALPALIQQFGAHPKRIRFVDTQSRWGSCTSDGVIALSWRLAFAPPEVCFYVLCHELAHLKQPNHSPAFWREVALLCPDWKPARSWLKREGHTLHRYG